MKIQAYQSEEGHYFVETELQPVQGMKADFALDTLPVKQTILGFGGAITDAAIGVYLGLEQTQQKKVFDLIYSPEGLNYNYARLTIGSCDFSRTIYDYAQKDDLSDFSLAHDAPIIALVKQAQKKGDFHVLASCWSPLARYKDNGDKSHGGHLKPECYAAHADYIARYVKEMGKLGVQVEALTIQNEPEATQTWESCRFSAEEEARLALLLHERLPHVDLYAWDHNRDVLVRRITATFSDPAARSAYAGIAYHWYDPGCSQEIAKVHALFPEKKILFSEGCVELLNLNPKDPASAIGSYNGLLRYADNYIQDLNAGSQGFIDWNILLDDLGGPNHMGNYCEAPIMAGHNRFAINPSYHAIKHFSHFVKEGASFLSLPEVSQIEGAAFRNPDGSLVLVILNKGKEKPISFSIENVVYSVYLKGNSLVTFLVTL